MFKSNALLKSAALFLLLFAAGYSVMLLSLPSEKILITIPENATGGQIAKILKENKIILNEDIFLMLSDISGSSKKLKKGTYQLSRRMNSMQVITLLRSGKTYAVKITVPEGFTAEQAAALLEQKGLVKKEDFLSTVSRKKLEGFLFPETYFIESGMSSDSVAAKMFEEFKKVYSNEFKQRERELKMNTAQVVTLASIIEKEARLDTERPLISGIFHNRLRKGWMLESCATVRYALSKYSGGLSYTDLKFASPYNTYKNRGLPPGPICNPGLPSIKAALYPEKTELMFFFSAGGFGTHEFSRYYESHLKGQRKNGVKRTKP